ncbi:MAG: outer membrane protein assembly factor [Bacteroidales bacterium]|nr:outer membrane protein assembly factor [Bacteroidales bacterium]
MRKQFPNKLINIRRLKFINHISVSNVFLFFSFSLLLCFYSCSSTKFVPDGEYLLDKVKIQSDIPEYKGTDLKPYVRQQPNYKMFGINKTMFQIYNLAGKDSTKWLNKFIKKIGEPPVIFDSTLVEKTDTELKKLFINKGYINVDISSEIIYNSKNDKKVDVIYNVKGNTPYRIRNYFVAIEDTIIRNILFGETDDNSSYRLQGESSSLRNTRIKEGMLFDRDQLDAERNRLTSILRNRGYYSFVKENFYYDADSSFNINAVDLELKLRPFLTENISENKIDTTTYPKYYFDRVYIFLDYDPLHPLNINEYNKRDSINIDKYTINYSGNKPSLRPKTLLDHCFLTPNREYAQLREDQTYSSFSTLQALNNIHIHYEEKQRNDTTFLDCHILTMPSKKQALSFSIEGTNTAGDLGIASSVSYTHRNLFRGAEVFNFRIRGAYEALSNLNPYFEFGGEASIHLPKFMFPFIKNTFSRRMRTSTEFTLSYNYQTRPEYDRTILSAGIRYQWQNRLRMSKRHQLDLLDVDYVYLPYMNEEFMNSLPNNAKYFGYTNQFIVGTSYSYYQSTFDPLQKQKGAYSFRFSVESAGNVLYGISSLFNRKKDEMNSYQLFGTHFAQFIKGDIDYAKTIVIDKQNTIAWRIGAGIGIPYGNSKMLPFEKRYYSGGANSVRAWSVRELGPGSYKPTQETNFFHQSGDIKFDANLEYRTRFFWKFEAALFIDAGNIWTIKNYEDQEGGQFKLNSFYKEIALGYGAGLRLDFDYFLIRFDFGWKAYDPSKDKGKKWAFLHPNFKNNFAWHIAVGYPF